MISGIYIEAIFDIVSVTIATLGQHKICLFFHKIVYILKINSVTCRFCGPCNTLPSHFSSPHRSKSIPVSSNGVPSLVLNSGNGAVVGARYGLVEKTLQVLHRLMDFLTLDHKCGTRYCSLSPPSYSRLRDALSFRVCALSVSPQTAMQPHSSVDIPRFFPGIRRYHYLHL